MAGVTRDHRAPVSAANGPPRWSAVPKGSEAPKLAVLNHPQHVPQPSIPKTAPQTQNVKSSEVLRRSSCRRRVNLTCDSASHLRERTVVGRSTEHQYQPSVDVPSHHPLLVRSSTYILFHCIVLLRLMVTHFHCIVIFLRLMVTHFHCIVLLRFSFASSFYFALPWLYFLDKPRFATKVYAGAQE